MRLHQLLKAKLHHAHITYANPNYVGSIEVDREVMEQAGLVDGEHVHVWAVDHTARLETYIFGGPRGVVGMNGGAAHHFNVGDRLIIAAFTWTDEKVVPKMLHLNAQNEVIGELEPFTVTGEKVGPR